MSVPAPSVETLPRGRIAVVGGCGGLGFAVVEELVAAGCEVVVLDLPASLQLRSLPEGVRGIAFDGRQESQVAEAFEAVRDAGESLDGLVVASGYAGTLETVGDLTVAEMDELYAGNLRLTMLVCREAMPLLRASQGVASVVTLSSGLAYVAQPGYASYASSKAGIIAMSRALAREEAPKVRVNVVAPGGIRTAFMTGGFGRGGEASEEPVRLDVEKYVSLVPLGRLGEPEDVAGPVLFLLSDAARYITGEVLHVNGGGLMY